MTTIRRGTASADLANSRGVMQSSHGNAIATPDARKNDRRLTRRELPTLGNGISGSEYGLRNNSYGSYRHESSSFKNKLPGA
jgi:hypothetical protein